MNWGLVRNLGDIFASLLQTLTSEVEDSIEKHAGSSGAALVGGVGGKGLHHFFSSQMDKMFFDKKNQKWSYLQKDAECAETNEKLFF